MHATLQEEIFFLSFPKGVILLCMNSLREYIMKEKKKKEEEKECVIQYVITKLLVSSYYHASS